MKMSSYGTFNEAKTKKSTGIVASARPTGQATLQNKIDFAQRFAEFSSLLLQGFSFPLHDDIDHDVLAAQSGRSNVYAFDEYLNTIHPPMYLFYLWNVFYLTLVFFSHIDTTSKFIVFIFGFFLYVVLFVAFCRLLYKWLHDFFRPVLEPQMGTLGVDPFLKEAIHIWCLFESLRDARTKRGMIAAIVQYMQAHTTHSLPLTIYRKAFAISYISDWTSDEGYSFIEQMINSSFDNTLEDDDNGEVRVLDPQNGNVPWHIACDAAFTKWKTFRESPMACKFSHFINVIVSAGMCSTSNLEFKLGNVALFSPIVMKKQLSSADVFEAFYEAVSGFMKGGWKVYETGTISAFFTDDDAISEFDMLYNKIQQCHGYALTGNLREYTDIDDNEYDNCIKKAILFGEELLKTIKRAQTFERKYVSDRIDKMRGQESEFTQLRTRGGLRVSPFAICLFGRSGCGKSSLTNLSIVAGLKYNGLSYEKDRIATWADNDKFASAVRSHINAIIFDDFANTKEDFMDHSPAYRLIQVINNIRYLAPMADVFLKGKVSLNPYFCIVSTNVENLNAHKYSNEPESVLRRLYHVKVEPKLAYCENGILNKAKIEAAFGHTACPDVWNLTVRYYDARNKRYVDPHSFKPVTFEGQALENISVARYLRWVQVASKKHFEEERQLLANQEADPVECSKCKFTYCDCSLHGTNSRLEEKVKEDTIEPHSGSFEQDVRSYFERKAADIQDYYARAESRVVIASSFICDRWNRFDCLPERYVCHPSVLKFGLYFWKEDLKQSLIAGNSFIFFMLVVLLYGVPCLAVFSLFFSMVSSYLFTCATVQVYQRMIRDRILELKDVVSSYTQAWQTKYAIISLGAISMVLFAMRFRQSRIEPHTGLNPENIEEINERNDATNPWLPAETVPLPMSAPCRTTTSVDLVLAMRTNLVGIVSDRDKTTLGFYIASNFVLVPTHFIEEHGLRDFNVCCYKTGEHKVGSYFRDKIAMSYTTKIPCTDYSLCYMTSGGSMKDLRKFLAVDKLSKSIPAKFVTREIMDKSLRSIQMLCNPTTIVTTTKNAFSGSYYNLSIETKSGMCMSPIISDTKGSTILGFHLGGKGKLGGCGFLTKSQVDVALQQLSNVHGVVLSASCGDLHPHMGDFPSSTYNQPIVKNTEIHPKSAVNFLTEGAFIDVFGQTSGKATSYSNVCDTIISDAVERHFGVPQKWGPPKLKGKGVYPYQATLVHAAVPSLPLGSILSVAVGSYKSLTENLKLKIPELFEVGPLSDVATVSGLIGVKFIDAMNFSTSPGFPMTGSKMPLLIDLNPEEYPMCGKPRTFVPEVWEEVRKMSDTLRSGERCYTIWKSCLKDEATKLTKDKVRVFQSAPLALQILIRKYFLPIVRIMQMNPILYECAVGVNAEGLEWEELWEAAMSKGKDRVLAGDYSKYDVRMPAQATLAAFDILLDIAKNCTKYVEEDLCLMRMMVHEVVYPIMAYNGDLIQLFGTNPSGQNLTVIINSIVNSLLLRCAFFTRYPDKEFKEHCAFLTYGDDVIGTVAEDCGEFTHITYAEFLAQHDMKFTMPDKESEPTDYMKESDVDFLKRKCVYNEDLGVKVGLLSEDSIFKRLHAHILSKELTLSEHSAENIESSLRDWFYYGREVYEDRQRKLKCVAEDSGILHLCPSLDVSYDKRVSRWRHKYLGEELEEDVSVEQVLEIQCGDMAPSTGYDLYDHCRGSSLELHFWWEYWAAYLSVAFSYFVWPRIAFGKTTVKIFPHFSKPILWYILTVYTQGMSIGVAFRLIAWCLEMYVVLYALPFVYWCVFGFPVDDSPLARAKKMQVWRKNRRPKSSSLSGS